MTKEEEIKSCISAIDKFLEQLVEAEKIKIEDLKLFKNFNEFLILERDLLTAISLDLVSAGLKYALLGE